MSKKTNSKARFMVTIVFAIVLCLSMAMPAFASTELSEATGTTSADQAKAAITKILTMPEGTTTPAKTFTYEFTKKGILGDANPNDTTKMPGIKDVTITYAAADTATLSGGVKKVIKESIDFIDNDNLVGAWDHAGTHYYRLTEVDEEASNDAKNIFTYSIAEYDIYVYVDNGTDDNLYVKYVEAKIAVKDFSHTTQPIGQKVDPTPGPNEKYPYSQVIFTNYFLKKNGGDEPTIANTVLGISKNVDGQGADQTRLFEFSVTIKKPATIDDVNTTYKGYIMEGSTVIPPNTTIVPSPGVYSGNYIQFKNGVEVKVMLKHGQKLAFMELPVGASFFVKEKGTPGYTARYTAVSQSNLPTGTPLKGVVYNGSAGADFGFTADELIGDIETTHQMDGAEFINDTKAVAPTGISMETLPFIVLIVVVAAAIAGFAVIRYRKNANYNA